MSKIRLDLDALSVESFSTDEAPARGGTVQAHSPVGGAYTDLSGCGQNTCADYCSDGYTCLFGCAGTSAPNSASCPPSRNCDTLWQGCELGPP